MHESAHYLAPSDWISTMLGEVALCTLGGTPSTDVPQFWGGDIPWMASGDVNMRRVHEVSGRITEAGLAASNATLVQSPAVAVGLAGQGKTRGTVALTLCTLSTNQSIALLQGNYPVLQTEYLFHNLDRRYEELRARSSGGGRGGLSKGILDTVPIDLPPLREQRLITQILDTLDTTISQTEAIIAKLKQVKQGLLHDLLTRGIAANGELRPPQSQAPDLYKESSLGWIPREWETRPLGELAVSSVIGPFGSDLVASDYCSEGVPIIFVRDVKSDRFIWKSNVFVNPAKASALVAHEARPGDVIATKMGFPPCIAAVYPDSMPCGIVTADIVRLRFDSGQLRPAWVSRSINDNAVIKQVEQITAGVTRPKVTLRDVRALQIRVPCIAEQDRILERVANVDNRLEVEYGMRDKLRMTKVGLMDDLLTGRVRVTSLLQGTTP